MIIGKQTINKKKVSIDLAKLISTRLLIQANSGGGKSWLIRRLLEQSHGKVQQIVLDLEGEFSTLREEYDYLLVGKNGEIPANIQTAELLAIKLLKLNVSTIIDLSELKHHERITFVKRFLDSLIGAPRELWHTCLVIVDEAHQFCPEKSKSESASSVIDLQTRGRKRGFCGVLATQRISKLHKDAAAECNNVLVGRTVQDIDRKRASDDLGFTTKEQERSLRQLGDGEFFAYGPAICKDDVIKLKVGDVRTTHPEPGKSILKASQTPDNIKKLMKDVIDLPKEAEEDLQTKKDFQNKIYELKKEIRYLKISQPKPIADEKALERSKIQGFKEAERISMDNLKKTILALTRFKKGVEQIVTNCSKLLQVEAPTFIHKSKLPLKEKVTHSIQRIVTTQPREVSTTNDIDNVIDDIEEKELGLCPKRVYSFLFANPERGFTKIQLGLMTGYSPKSGGFSNAIYNLNARGLVRREGNLIHLKEVDPQIASETKEEFSIDLFVRKLPKCPKEIFKLLLDNPYQEYSKEEIAEQTGYSSGSGGFSNSLYKLNSLGIIKRDNGQIKLNPEILEIE